MKKFCVHLKSDKTNVGVLLPTQLNYGGGGQSVMEPKRKLEKKHN